MEYPQQGDLVRVTWTDSGMQLDAGWKSLMEAQTCVASRDTMLVETVGFYLGDAEWEDVILIAQSKDPHNDHYLNVQAIYRPCILDIVRAA